MRLFLLQFFIFWMLSPCSVKAQVNENSDIPSPARKVVVKKSQLKNPALLVDFLTDQKASDFSKFEALYNWVMQDIDYDYYNDYYTSGITTQPDLRRTLKRKKANKVEFAYLMDTLCKLAGINSTVLSGYKKDFFFDVGDSLYNDTHIWNAVKLDNAWYLFDISSSKGIFYYRYSRFSRFIVRIKKKFTVKYVYTSVRKKQQKYYRSGVCGGTVVSEGKEETIHYWKPVYRHKLLRKILSRFRLKIILDYKQIPTKKFFLTPPVLFAVTHFPDNPEWSLLSKTTCRFFESDSAFYHLTDSLYSSQQRNGSSCISCDDYLRMEELPQAFYYRKKSDEFNKRNRCTPTVCEHKIAALNFVASKKTEDSASKITLLDTALAFIQHAKDDLRKATLYLGENHSLQSAKNSKKLSDLADENRKHSLFIRHKMEISFQETKNIRDLENKTDNDAKKYYFRNRVIAHYKNGGEINREVQRVETTISFLITQLKRKLAMIDSVNLLISNARSTFEKELPGLHTRLQEKVLHHDSLLVPLYQRIGYRNELQDSYKKSVVEAGKRIAEAEQEYSNALDSSIYRPADVCYQLGKKISWLVDERNKMRFESYRIKTQLVKFSETEPAELDQYKELLKDENRADLCWIKGRGGYLSAIFYGFKALLGKQKLFDDLLTSEKGVEVIRYKITKKELARAKKGHQVVLRQSRLALTLKNREIKKDKSDYLKALRKLRREQRLSK